MCHQEKIQFVATVAILTQVALVVTACSAPAPPATKATKNEICIDGNCLPLQKVVEGMRERSTIDEMLVPWKLPSNRDKWSRVPRLRTLWLASFGDLAERKLAFVLDKEEEPLPGYAVLGPASDKCLFRMVARQVERGWRAIGSDCHGRSVSIEICITLDTNEYSGWRLYPLETDPCGWHVGADPRASRDLFRKLAKSGTYTVSPVSFRMHPQEPLSAFWMITKDAALLINDPSEPGERWGLVRDWDIAATAQDTVVEWCHLESPTERTPPGPSQTDRATIMRTGTRIKVTLTWLWKDKTLTDEYDLTPHPVIEYGYWDWLSGS